MQYTVPFLFSLSILTVAVMYAVQRKGGSMNKAKKFKTWLAGIMLIVTMSALFGDFGLLAAIALIYFIFLP